LEQSLDKCDCASNFCPTCLLCEAHCACRPAGEFVSVGPNAYQRANSIQSRRDILAADLKNPALAWRQILRRHEVDQHVVHGDGLGQSREPAWQSMTGSRSVRDFTRSNDKLPVPISKGRGGAALAIRRFQA
jgi:hypothetical protein